MSVKIDWLHHESITKANYCDTCCHQYSDICGGCESLEGVPVKYTEKEREGEMTIDGLFDKDEKSGENTGFFAIIVQNMKTYEHHEMIRFAVKLPCKIIGECDTDSNAYIIRLEHN